MCWLKDISGDLAPVVQRVDSVICWISCYPVDEIGGKTRYSRLNLMQIKGKSVSIIGLCKNLAEKHQTEYVGCAEVIQFSNNWGLKLVMIAANSTKIQK